MSDLKPGDRVDCRIKDSQIISPYMSYDEIKTFEIVSSDHHGYYIFVPEYYSLKNTIKVDKHQLLHLNIHKKFLNEQIIYIQSNMICQIKYIMDGMMCKRCEEFCEMSEPNQKDGTFICYSCKFNRYR